jgi:hypothetical protein
MAYPTNPIYKLVKTKSRATGEEFICGVLRGTDGAGIPIDEGNIDYLEYLAWVKEGNTAEAAD